MRRTDGHIRGSMFVNHGPEEGVEMDESRTVLSVGDQAPQIDAEITQGGLFDLSLERGKWVVVYFFPRSGTPG